MKRLEREKLSASLPSPASRLPGTAVKLPAIVVLLSLAACGTSSEDKITSTPGKTSGAPSGQSFLKIGSRSITETVQAESFFASRCIFRTPGPAHTAVVLQAPIRQAPEPARAELTALLAGLEKRRAGSEDSAGKPMSSAPVRVYQLQTMADWIIDLSLEEFISEPTRVRVVCNLRNKGEQEIAITVSAPGLLEFLRERTAEALLEQMKRPRIPLNQHFLALAGFLDTGTLTTAELKRARRLLISKAGKSAKDPSLVYALLGHLGSFDERDLAALESDGGIATRVFYLAWSANRGLKKPLGELLVLSLEYHGDAILFQRALTALFPAAQNSRLYALHPPGRDREGALAFIRALRETISKAKYQDGKGWLLEL